MTPAPSPTTTPTPRSDADRALTQYRAFWRALPLASNELPARRRGILEKYLADPELNRTLEGMAAQDATGRRIYGENKPRATVTSLTGASAVITDCQDSSGSGVLDTASGRHLTVGVARNLVISDMRRDSEGVWRITSGRYQSRKC